MRAAVERAEKGGRELLQWDAAGREGGKEGLLYVPTVGGRDGDERGRGQRGGRDEGSRRG